MATALNNLANVLNIEGHYHEARELSQRALAIMEEALRPKHPEVAAMLYYLGEMFYIEGHLDEARDLFQRALATLEEALGPSRVGIRVSR